MSCNRESFRERMLFVCQAGLICFVGWSLSASIRWFSLSESPVQRANTEMSAPANHGGATHQPAVHKPAPKPPAIEKPRH